MKKLLIILFLYISLNMSGATYYLSPNGSDSNPGTMSQPFLTLKKAWSVIAAGDIVYMRGGTYLYSTSQELTGINGTSSSPISIMAYNNEVPIVSRAGSWSYYNRAGIYFEGNYFHWKGIKVQGFIQSDNNLYYAMIIQRANHNVLEQMTFSHSGMGFDVSHYSTDNLILNCDFHHNYDPNTSSDPYGNADGANAHTDQGTTNTFRNCRFYNNSDDGIDLYNGDGLILIDGCWSYMNGYRKDQKTKGGDGYGYKLGKTSGDFSSSHLRTVTNSFAFHNRLGGFGINEARCIVWLYNNTAYHNNDGEDYSLGFAFDGQDGISHVLKNNIGYGNQNTRGLEANWTSQSTCDHNSWSGAVSVSNADFITTDSTGASGTRNSSGNLPEINFMRLASGSDLIDAGTTVGLAYTGKAPDLGALEASGTVVVTVPVPVALTSAIENSTPSLLVLTYDLSLSSSNVPSPTAFSVTVNSVAVPVSTVAISSNKVQLTLSRAIKYGDIIKVSYTKPSTKQLQTTTGGIAANISSLTASNNLAALTKDATPVTLTMTISPNHVHRTVNLLLGYSGALPAQIAGLTPEVVKITDTTGKLFVQKSLVSGTTSVKLALNLKSGIYNVAILANGVQLVTKRIMVY